MEREWNRATHRYVRERLHAKEAQWQLQENQSILGRTLIHESLRHATLAMDGLTRYFLTPSSTIQNVVGGSIRTALANKINQYEYTKP